MTAGWLASLGLWLAACGASTLAAPTASPEAMPSEVHSHTTPPATTLPATVETRTWRDMPLTDARTGATVRLSDYGEQTVILAMMDPPCHPCRDQLEEVGAAREVVGEKAVAVSVDVGGKGQTALVRWADQNGASWPLVSMLNPCVLPLYPGFLAYLANNTVDLGGSGSVRYWGLLVLAGVMTMTLSLGALIEALTEALGGLAALAALPGAVVMIGLGLLLLLDVNPPARLPQLAALPRRVSPHARAYVYGLLYGPMILPCCGPLVVSLFSLSLGIVGFVEHLLYLLIFGLGLGLPLLALSFLPKAWAERLLRQVTRRARLISRLSGLVLLILGVWNLLGNWTPLRWYLGG